MNNHYELTTNEINRNVKQFILMMKHFLVESVFLNLLQACEAYFWDVNNRRKSEKITT